jgi:hypothetical protein
MTTHHDTRSAAAETTRKVLSRIVLVLAIAATVGFVYIQPGKSLLASTIDQPTASALRGEAPDDVGAIEASRKLRCIMPPAWRRGCGE